MKLTILTFFIFFISISWGQREFSQLDSSVARDGLVYYRLEVGVLKGRKRIGKWTVHQYNSKNSKPRLAAQMTYEKGFIRSQSIIRLDSEIRRTFSGKGKKETEIQFRYGKQIWSRKYLSPTKTNKKTYYPDGKVSGEGEEQLMVITGGCDSGMKVFVQVGVWKYYDSSGKLMDEQEMEFNKNIYKKA
ncbi:MAG: antitoxin component YwqK of YwqJK toxin-antitoxin module [Arenicella sp.]|jgi:antitoxin component YwqK of YwqJK toxin-antitoxin module